MLTKVEGWVLKRKKYVREFGPTSQGIWSPKTLNLVRLLLGRIPLLKMLGSAARSIFLAKKGPPGDQIPCLQHIYIYICRRVEQRTQISEKQVKQRDRRTLNNGTRLVSRYKNSGFALFWVYAISDAGSSV